MEAVRHFLGFADESDARVGRTACWRRLVMVGELPQMKLPQSAAANRTRLRRARCRAWKGLRLVQVVVGGLPLRMSAAGLGCYPENRATDEIKRALMPEL